MGRRAIDRTGQRYGRLTVIRRTARYSATTNAWWTCRCDCGRMVDISGSGLTSNETPSCGCYGRESRQAKLMARWASTHAKAFVRRDAADRREAIAVTFARWLKDEAQPAMLTLTKSGAWRASHSCGHAVGQGSVIVGTYAPGVAAEYVLEDMAEVMRGDLARAA